MIQVTVKKDQNGYVSFESCGHAQFAEEGQDIVCAGVSALVIAVANGLEAFTPDAYLLEEGDGYVRWEFLQELSASGTVLMDTLILGLKDMQESYKQFLHVEIKEVDES